MAKLTFPALALFFATTWTTKLPSVLSVGPLSFALTRVSRERLVINYLFTNYALTKRQFVSFFYGGNLALINFFDTKFSY